MKKVTLIFLTLAALASCRKAELKGDYFAFGYAGGQIAGTDHANFFLLKDHRLYPDNMSGLTEEWSFKNDKLSKDKYKLAKQLLGDLPSFLKDHSSATFGCPDCADQGGYHIQIGEKSSVKTFHIDTDVSKQPAEIREYIVSLKSVIKQLEEK